MDPQEAFTSFRTRAGENPNAALAFFVGYAYGACGAHESIEALVAAFNALPASPTDGGLK